MGKDCRILLEGKWEVVLDCMDRDVLAVEAAMGAEHRAKLGEMEEAGFELERVGDELEATEAADSAGSGKCACAASDCACAPCTLGGAREL